MLTLNNDTLDRCYSCDRAVDTSAATTWYGSVNRFEMGYRCVDCSGERIILDTDYADEY